MGPQASIDFLQKILNLTIANKDQEHIRVILDNNCHIPDRVSPIIASGPSPAFAMQKSLNILIRAGAKRIAMPCMTAHHFREKLVVPPSVMFLDMPGIVASACHAEFPGNTAGVLCTHGTAKSSVLRNSLDRHNVKHVFPSEGRQNELSKIIGRVKAEGVTKETARQFAALAGELAELKVDYFILACTELSVIAAAYDFTYPHVDSLTELAKAAITSCGYVYRRED
jgi:aspartate racemase